MNRTISVLVVVGALLAARLPAGAATVEVEAAPAADVLPGSAIVALEPGGVLLTANGTFGKLAKRFGIAQATSLDPSGASPLANVYELAFEPEVPVADVVAAFAGAKGVRYAEPNALYHPTVLNQDPPNDPLVSQSWHLSKVNAMAGWLVSWGSATVPIAVIDTGVKWDHPDLAANIWINSGEFGPTTQQGPAPNCATLGLPLNKNCNNLDDDGNGRIDDWRGWDFVNTVSTSCGAVVGEDCLTQDNNPADHYGHGTAVAGATAAVTNNGIGVAGVCRACAIMPLRAGYTAVNASGIVTGASLSTTAIASAITYAVANGARVINGSFAGGFSTTVQNAITFAASQGVLFVAAAGNGDTDVPTLAFPGNAANAIGVGATEQNDQKAWMSNYGAWVDLAAPGVSIQTTMVPFAPVGGDPDGDGYGALDGTSFAAPIVSGIAGLLIAKNPNMTADQARTMLQSGVDALATSQHLGTGRVNAQKTLWSGLSGFNPPTALLAPNLDNANSLGAPIIVSGTASGPNFTSYRLDAGAGVNPTAWTNFVPVTTAPVVNGALGTLNPAALGLANGVYTIRLIVQSGQKTFRDDTLVNIN